MRVSQVSPLKRLIADILCVCHRCPLKRSSLKFVPSGSSCRSDACEIDAQCVQINAILTECFCQIWPCVLTQYWNQLVGHKFDSTLPPPLCPLCVKFDRKLPSPPRPLNWAPILQNKPYLCQIWQETSVNFSYLCPSILTGYLKCVRTCKKNRGGVSFNSII